MSELIRCAKCEGWGITSYEADGSPNACDKCNGAGQVQAPPPPVYAPSERDKLLEMAEVLKDSGLSDVSQFAQAVIDYLDGEYD
jgi:hypothetical protein